MKRFTRLAVLITLIISSAIGANPKPRIQIALLLDTSNSMDGLIEQAKTQLWSVVNEFAIARKDAMVPELQISLFEYGNDNLSGQEGFVRKITPLTTDLDLISEELFALTTNGGSEYCGRVIKEATNQLNWSAGHDDLKMIFIAGNEAFSQGQLDYRESCREAIRRGIVVNTIYCGDYRKGIEESWKNGADLADGSYINIDQNRVVETTVAPQDAEIMQLNGQLNRTYLGYGAKAKSSLRRQEAQDANMSSYAPSLLAERAASKSSGLYDNAGWDLVDAMESDSVSLDDIEEEQLPELLRDKTSEEKEAIIKQKADARKEIQERILQLNGERKRYIAEQRQAKSDSNSLEAAILEAVHKQAARKNYTFGDK